MRKRDKIKTAVLVFGDFALFYLALALALALRAPDLNFGLFLSHAAPFGINFAIWIIFFGAFGIYEMKGFGNIRHFIYRLLQATAFNVMLSSTFFYFFIFFEIEPRRNLLLTITLSTVFVFLWRLLFNLIIVKTPAVRALFFGKNSEIERLADYLLLHPQLGHKPLGFIEHEEELRNMVLKTKANTIIITNEIKENKMLVRALFQMIPMGISVIEFDAYYELLTGKVPLSLIEEIWFLENLIGIKKQFYEFFKKLTDIALAIILTLPALATFPLIALAIKLDSKGPVFFKQPRAGRNGKIFQLWKYRSMIENAEYIGGLKSMEGYDVRLTRIGAILRKTYLDEIPQIINVVKGEMSFVGPRPERPEYVKELKEQIPFYEMRLLAAPGLTGWAQINMENDASVEDAPEKMQYDLYYVKNRSFILDLLVALRTLATILRRQGR